MCCRLPFCARCVSYVNRSDVCYDLLFAVTYLHLHYIKFHFALFNKYMYTVLSGIPLKC